MRRRSNHWKGERLSSALEPEPLKAAVDALTRLLRSYDRYCAAPDHERWKGCERARKEAVAAVSVAELANSVQPHVAKLVQTGRAEPGQAVEILRNASPSVKRLELELADMMGFKETEFSAFVAAAIKSLKRAQRRHQPVMQPESPSALASLLNSAHDQLRATYESTKTPNRRERGQGILRTPMRRKRRERKQAIDATRRSVYVVGTIVADAGVPDRVLAFPVSYALGLGVAATNGRTRRRRGGWAP